MDGLDPILPELHEIAVLLQSEIPTQDRSYRLKTYKNSFHGSDAVAWFIKNSYAQNSAQALALGNLLLSVGFIRSGFKDYAFHANGLYSFTPRENMDQRRAAQLAQRDRVRTLEMQLRTTKEALEETKATQRIERLILVGIVLLVLVLVFSPNIYISAFFVMLCATITWHSDLNIVTRPRRSAAEVVNETLAENQFGCSASLGSVLAPAASRRSPVRPRTPALDSLPLPEDACELPSAPLSPPAKTPRPGAADARSPPRVDGPPRFFESLSELIADYEIEFSTSEEVYCACVVSDISLPGQPLVCVNSAFCEMTKYTREEVLGKNCRILQGPGTSKKDIQAIRDIVNSRSEGFVKILNYTKQGRPFINMLYLVPLRNRKGAIQFYLGCQTPISELEEESNRQLAIAGCDEPPPPPPAPGQVSRVTIQVRTEPFCSGPPNAKPLPFETEWFKGMFSMKSKTKINPDPYFADKNRMFEVQMQGVFKKSFPETTHIWFGGEIGRPMQLGRFKRAMAGLLLKFVSSFGRGLHYSFGDNESNEDRPHMVFPLLAAIDRCIITPPDGVPPVLGEAIPDSAEGKAFRRTTPSTGATFQVGPIYTLCFYSMYIDFESWESCNLTGFSNMNLHTFWEHQKLTFIMYALDGEAASHSVNSRKIICQFDVSHDGDASECKS